MARRRRSGRRRGRGAKCVDFTVSTLKKGRNVPADAIALSVVDPSGSMSVPRWKNAFQTSDEIFRLKRAAVLREANRIIGRSGFHNTSLDDIAAALQVSKGTLYNYVADKQEILFECHMAALDIGERAFQFAEENGVNGFERFRLLLRAYVVWMNGVIGGGVMSDVSALRPQDREVVIARRDGSDAKLIQFIEDGIEDGSIRKVDPKMVLFTIMGAVNSIPTWYLPDGRLTPEQIANEMLDLVARGMAADPDMSENLPIPSYGSVGGPALFTSGQTVRYLKGAAGEGPKKTVKRTRKTDAPAARPRRAQPAAEAAAKPRTRAQRVTAETN